MSILETIFYGILQGLTEFLPVSSSGHLAVFQKIFNQELDEQLLYNLLLHVGTLAAVLLVYRKEVLELITGFFTLAGKLFKGKFKYSQLKPNEKFVILVLIATVPLGIGVFLQKYVEFTSGYIKAVGIFWLINAGILFLSDRLKKGFRTVFHLYPANALIIGVFQLLAVFPGISRSGMTITGGLFNGLNRESAVKFSFIMSIPAILGATVFETVDVLKEGTAFTTTEYVSFGVGMAAAFIAGLCAITLLRYISKKKNFTAFSVYCLIAGLAALILG